jgi:hypothetical protein
LTKTERADVTANQQGASLPRYCYNVVFNDGTGRRVLERFDAHDSAESPAEFGRRVLLDVLASNPGLNDAFVNVNVWDFDAPGIREPAKIIGSFSVHDLDQGPFLANQLQVSFHTYYIISAGYDDFPDDAVLGHDGLDVVSGVPYGLVVPGEGPALKIRTGHSDGWITLDTEILDAAPGADLDAWEAMEEATPRPQGELRVADWQQSPADGFPDLAGPARSGYLTIRVSARGRDAPRPAYGGRHPRRFPMEHHRVQAWPAEGPSAHAVVKRDTTTASWESCR